jgi:hypothetical protein
MSSAIGVERRPRTKNAPISSQLAAPRDADAGKALKHLPLFSQVLPTNPYPLGSEPLFALQRCNVCHHSNAIPLEHHFAVTLAPRHPISSAFVDLE